MGKSNLSIEVHDHFRKANMLHTYVQKDLGEATKHALETGQELLLAKAAIPHGSWEKECDRLFDGSLRTAQFYMQFAKNMMALPKAQSSSLLFLEPTLESAAKAAREAARAATPRLAGPPQPETEVVEEPEHESEVLKKPEKPPKQYPRSHWLKAWHSSIAPVVKLVDKIAKEVGEMPCESQKLIQDHLDDCTAEMNEWMASDD